eukprot:UC4_evm1s704
MDTIENAVNRCLKADSRASSRPPPSPSQQYSDSLAPTNLNLSPLEQVEESVSSNIVDAKIFACKIFNGDDTRPKKRARSLKTEDKDHGLSFKEDPLQKTAGDLGDLDYRKGFLPVKEISEILDWRVPSQDFDDDSIISDDTLLSIRDEAEVYFSWKNMSYWHARWAHVSQVRAAAPELIKKFWEKKAKKKPLSRDQLPRGVNADWFSIDKVLSIRENLDGPEYLIKWKGLPYSRCTWENAVDITRWLKFERPLLRIPSPLQDEKILSAISKRINSKGFDPWIQMKRYIQKKLNSLSVQRQPSCFQQGLLLADHQIVGVAQLLSAWSDNESALLADESGMGKRTQVASMISVLATHSSTKIKGPFLIAAPQENLRKWEEVLATWTSMLDVVVLDGGDEDLEVIKNFAIFKHGKVNITESFKNGSMIPGLILSSFENLKKWQEFFMTFPWICLVAEYPVLRSPEDIDGFRFISDIKSSISKVLLIDPKNVNAKMDFEIVHSFFHGLKSQSILDSILGSNTNDEIPDIMKNSLKHVISRPINSGPQPVESFKEIYLEANLGASQYKAYSKAFSKYAVELCRMYPRRSKLLILVNELLAACDHVSFTTSMKETVGKLSLLKEFMFSIGENRNVCLHCRKVSNMNLVNKLFTGLNFSVFKLDDKVKLTERQETINSFAFFKGKKILLLCNIARKADLDFSSIEAFITYEVRSPGQDILDHLGRSHLRREINVYRLSTKKTIEKALIEHQDIVYAAALPHSHSTVNINDLFSVIKSGLEIFFDGAKNNLVEDHYSAVKSEYWRSFFLKFLPTVSFSQSIMLTNDIPDVVTGSFEEWIPIYRARRLKLRNLYVRSKISSRAASTSSKNIDSPAIYQSVTWNMMRGKHEEIVENKKESSKIQFLEEKVLPPFDDGSFNDSQSMRLQPFVSISMPMRELMLATGNGFRFLCQKYHFEHVIIEGVFHLRIDLNRMRWLWSFKRVALPILMNAIVTFMKKLGFLDHVLKRKGKKTSNVIVSRRFTISSTASSSLFSELYPLPAISESALEFSSQIRMEKSEASNIKKAYLHFFGPYADLSPCSPLNEMYIGGVSIVGGLHTPQLVPLSSQGDSAFGIDLLRIWKICVLRSRYLSVLETNSFMTISLLGIGPSQLDLNLSNLLFKLINDPFRRDPDLLTPSATFAASRALVSKSFDPVL